MTATLQPTTLAELAAAVASAPRVLAVGASTKPRMGQGDAVKISTARLSGVTEYEPSEFVFTALGGTPLRDISESHGMTVTGFSITSPLRRLFTE